MTQSYFKRIVVKHWSTCCDHSEMLLDKWQ